MTGDTADRPDLETRHALDAIAGPEEQSLRADVAKIAHVLRLAYDALLDEGFSEEAALRVLDRLMVESWLPEGRKPPVGRGTAFLPAGVFPIDPPPPVQVSPVFVPFQPSSNGGWSTGGNVSITGSGSVAPSGGNGVVPTTEPEKRPMFGSV